MSTSGIPAVKLEVYKISGHFTVEFAICVTSALLHSRLLDYRISSFTIMTMKARVSDPIDQLGVHCVGCIYTESVDWTGGVDWTTACMDSPFYLENQRNTLMDVNIDHAAQAQWIECPMWYTV